MQEEHETCEIKEFIVSRFYMYLRLWVIVNGGHPGNHLGKLIHV